MKFSGIAANVGTIYLFGIVSISFLYKIFTKDRYECNDTNILRKKQNRLILCKYILAVSF